MKKINEVSKLAGVSKRTLQYYDDEGIVLVKRGENNHRIYDQKALEQIWRIMIYKEMGLDLKEIKRIFGISESEQRKILEQRLHILRSQIEELKEQMEFILLILEGGMPSLPQENQGITYVAKIESLRKRKK